MSFLDPLVGAVAYGAEVTQLGVIGYGAEVRAALAQTEFLHCAVKTHINPISNVNFHLYIYCLHIREGINFHIFPNGGILRGELGIETHCHL
jgi:hypothetical protein